MQSLSSTLLAAQKTASINIIYKLVLTKTGEDTKTYTKTRIRDIIRDEYPWSQRAEVELDNSDGTLTALNFKGYQGVLSYGATTSEGDEYEAKPPLTVIGQQFESKEGHPGLICKLQLIGIPNLLAEDKANASYVPTSADTKTTKTIISDMFDGTMACFDHCKTYTVDWDSEDALIDVYTPKDSFRIYKDGSRLEALKRLLDDTHCVARFRADGHIHIFVPRTS